MRVFPDPSSADSRASADPGGRSDVLATGRLYEDDGKTTLDLRPAYRRSRMTARRDGPRLRLDLAGEGPLVEDRRSVRVRLYGPELPRPSATRPGVVAERDDATGTLVVAFPPGSTEVILER